MNLIVLIQIKEELYNLCLDAVQAPPRVQQEVSSTLTSFTLFPMKPKRYVISPLKLN